MRRATIGRAITPNIPQMVPAADTVVVLTTLATEAEAAALVRGLLERRVIACGTILPAARSLYRWAGQIADEWEVLVLLKTRADRVPDLEPAFAELHPYTVPELLTLPVGHGLEKYIRWVEAEAAP